MRTVLAATAPAGPTLASGCAWSSEPALRSAATSSQEAISFAHDLLASDFAADVAETWHSQFVRFFLSVIATVWLVQKGSSEPRELGRAGLESGEDQQVGGRATDRSPRWARVGGSRLRSARARSAW